MCGCSPNGIGWYGAGLWETPVNVSAVQEADQLDGISRKLKPQTVIAEPQSVVRVIAFDFLEMLESIQCIDRLQRFDELEKSVLYAGNTGDGLEISQERLGV
jgi:hypothetical protein